jgi:hypothetical protein
MGYIQGEQRNQAILFPVVLDDFGGTTPNVKNRTPRLSCANLLPVEKQTQQTFATQNIGILLSERRLAETFVCAWAISRDFGIAPTIFFRTVRPCLLLNLWSPQMSHRFFESE